MRERIVIFLSTALFLLVSCATAEKLVIGENAEEMYGVINKSGDWVLQPEYYTIHPTNDWKNFIAEKEDKGDSYSFLFDSNGNLLKKEKKILGKGTLSKYFAFRAQNGNWGCWDEDFNLVIPPEYEGISYLSKGKFIVKKDDLFYFFSDGQIGSQLKLPISENARSITAYEHQEGVVRFTYYDSDSKEIFVNAQGEFIDRPPYPTPPLRDGLRRKSIVIKNILRRNDGLEDAKLWGYVNEKDEFVIPPSFLFANDFSEGLALVKKDYSSKEGFLDTQGRWAISPRFMFASDFSEGLAAVALDQDLFSSGYIDHTGKWIIKPRFYKATSFRNGRAIVSIFLKKKECLP